MGSRHRARQLAVQALYALDANPAPGPGAASDSILGEAETGGDASGAPSGEAARVRSLVAGAWSRRKEIDAAIESVSKNWKISRMDRVDRSILRLGVFELLAEAEVPAPVVISEAVELAKEFGSGDSPSFINGLLDTLARTLRAAEVRVRS